MVKPKRGDWVITKPKYARKEFITQIVGVDKNYAYYINWNYWCAKEKPTKCSIDFDRLTVITKEVADIMRGV
jgi:hypothetical protein